jgi:hypothetical protein
LAASSGNNGTNNLSHQLISPIFSRRGFELEGACGSRLGQRERGQGAAVSFHRGGAWNENIGPDDGPRFDSADRVFAFAKPTAGKGTGESNVTFPGVEQRFAASCRSAYRRRRRLRLHRSRSPLEDSPLGRAP